MLVFFHSNPPPPKKNLNNKTNWWLAGYQMTFDTAESKMTKRNFAHSRICPYLNPFYFCVLLVLCYLWKGH